MLLKCLGTAKAIESLKTLIFYMNTLLYLIKIFSQNIILNFQLLVAQDQYEGMNKKGVLIDSIETLICRSDNYLTIP